MLSLFLVGMLSTGAPAATLQLSQNDLQTSVGFIRCEPYQIGGKPPVTVKVLSSEFEAFRTATNAAEYGNWLSTGHELKSPVEGAELFFYEPAQMPRDARARSILEYPEAGRIFTFWSNTGFETIKQALVVWKSTNGVLTFDMVLDHTLLEGIGRAYLVEAHKIGEGKHLIIGRTSGGDGGETWGSLWVGLWEEPRRFELVFRQRYRSNEAEQSDLQYEFDPKSLDLTIHLKKQKSAPDETGENHPLGWETARTWTVGLRERLNAGDLTPLTGSEPNEIDGRLELDSRPTPDNQAAASSGAARHHRSDEEIARNRADCTAKGGDFHKAGLRLANWICVTKLADAEKECSDGSECLGKACYIYGETTAKVGEPAHGTCRRDTNPFGCHRIVVNGKFAGSRCVD